ncbi:YqaJ viral recombinase family protein [Pseudomonas citronellolis]|uniref:YqaJ viral recombinase family protein n=1 Tax=Pseudomonas citronellolis TaxID=53408 RepID=UPI002D78FE61|nr:YqaJ viral recombinase family protein [Pseudomonas citronellolis]WRT83510.1 YqaJ viral recombinase family protein [Pseudomonas citronellolis]
MQIHNVTQGAPEWHALRANYFTASEAPTMMGTSKYQSRSELLAQKKTGIAPEVSESQQRLFDRGHETEALARAIIEAQLGEDLFPVVATEGNLLASVDGMDSLGTVVFEHKLWNEGLAEKVRAGDLEPHYYWQLEQQLLVTGAERAIFVCSDGSEDNMVQMEYRPVAGRREQLLAGWAQFEQDLAEFSPQEAKVEAVGRAPGALPALRIEVTGMVTASNLDAFKEHALAIFKGINTELQTDQDFANAEQTVKWCGDVEERLAAAKQHALSQTESIDALFRAIDEISAEARAKRLELDKLVKTRKEKIRTDIVTKAGTALREHIAQINETLGSRVVMPAITADFAGAIKGKKTVASLQDAANTELARAKIEASRMADGIRANLRSFDELAGDHASLFADLQQLVLKPSDDLVATVKSRITEHEAEQKRLEEKRAATVTQPAAEPVAQVAQRQAVSVAVVAPTEDDGLRIKLGDINNRLGFALTADFLRSIGFEPAGRERAAVLYRAADFQRICAALIAHIQQAQAGQQVAA